MDCLGYDMLRLACCFGAFFNKLLEKRFFALFRRTAQL